MGRAHDCSKLRERRIAAATRLPARAGEPAPRGRISFAGLAWDCVVGHGAIKARKREGDGATPMGCFTFERVLYRPDRIARPRSRLPIAPIRRTDGWCDAPHDRNYNRAVRLPYPASAETLWRDDRLYDLVLVISHNASPRVCGLGSAVFLHLAAPEKTPTLGCLAMAARDLRWLISHAGPGDRIQIAG